MNAGRRFPAFVVFAGLLAVAFAGCQQSRQSESRGSDAARANPRIVTLSPHLAELVHDAGAGDRLVGVSAYSNFPDEVRTLPQIGDAFLVDREQLTLLDPDIILAWASGTPSNTIDDLRSSGHRVEVLRTQRLADVPAALVEIGRLTGRQEMANAVAHRFVAELDRLRQAFDDRSPIRVFYQISSRPIYTVNGEHFASEIIELCGGTNIFADLGELAPLVSEESVLERNPEVIIAGGVPGDPASDDAFSEWQRWDEIDATRMGNFFTIDADLLARATTRLLDTADRVCKAMDDGRRRRASDAGA